MIPEWLHDVFLWVLRASWQASVLILLVLAVQWSLRGLLSPQWRFIHYFPYLRTSRCFRITAGSLLPRSFGKPLTKSSCRFWSRRFGKRFKIGETLTIKELLQHLARFCGGGSMQSI